MKRKLFTIGYTGFSIEQFTNMLMEHEVQCLIDIREIPISRKAGFSKTALINNLQFAGIKYQHFRLLGSPKENRHRVRLTKDYRLFFKEVHEHLRLDGSRTQLTEAIDIARQFRSCLMCCCPTWTLCHRKCVIEAIQKEAFFHFEHLGLSSCQEQTQAAA